MTVRTPLGLVTVHLRNFESLKTLFSIFCREDYFTDGDGPYTFLDVGANIGLASVYFLTRNPNNLARCFEPDRENLALLQKNLLAFGTRAAVVDCAVGVRPGDAVLYRSVDGKYSSLLPSERARAPQVVSVQSFQDIVTAPVGDAYPVVIKLDVEGIETDLVSSVTFGPHVRRLICESKECSKLINVPHKRTLRNGYVEDLLFARESH